MTKKEIIDLIASSYTLATRSTTINGGCSYLNEKGFKCAVGMTMTDNALFEYEDSDLFVSQLPDLNILQKEEFRGHSTDFWIQLQSLHDTEENWNDKGLSFSGLNSVERLHLTWDNL